MSHRRALSVPVCVCEGEKFCSAAAAAAAAMKACLHTVA